MPHLLPAKPDVSPELKQRLAQDFLRFAREGLPSPLEEYLLEAYRLDVSSTYAGLPIRNPWGKASGQLSMTMRQVEEDAAAGLGFVVLKTVIAQDASGARSMQAWAIPEARMVVEPIIGQTGERGWTVSWKGRGWSQSLADYLALVRNAVSLGQEAGMVIAASCKYHLPAPGEKGWRKEEYAYTTNQLLDAYAAGGGKGPMPLEKDFSPTLAGSERSRQQAQILSWLETVPELIREAAGLRPLRLGLKVFNALFDDAFQVEMLRTVQRAGPDFVVYGNRLFDPERVFEGHRGIAYGGPDLSDRNLRVLDLLREVVQSPLTKGGPLGGLAEPREDPPLYPPLRKGGREASLDWSGTGDIHSGKMALEYALRGCTSFQMHTIFQLPVHCYFLRGGNKTQKALHLLYFDPEKGFLCWMHHLARQRVLADPDGIIHFLRLASG